MSFRDNLINARSHIIFLIALISGLGLVTYLESGIEVNSSKSLNPKTIHAGQVVSTNAISAFDDIEALPVAAKRASTADELKYAKIAWRYFENNTNSDTGLVNSANEYASTTMWETGSYFIAVVSADLLGIIEPDEAISRISKTLDTLSSLRLYDEILPNKAYNVQTGELVDYSNKPSKIGLGWSALDIARVIATFAQIQKHYPDLTPKIAEIISHWDVSRLTRNGQLIGGNIADGKLREDQEGRVGYEQYAAKAMMLFGHDMYNAYNVEKTLMVKNVYDNPIPVDVRMHRNTIPAFTVSEPYMFDGLEFGFDSRSQKFATAIYKAQEARFRVSGILTAVSETHLDEAPYFIYSTIWGGGAPWAVLSFKGERFDSRRTISTKVAFAWNALFATEYTKELMTAITSLGDPDRGWSEGLYEIDGKTNTSITANTNAVVLASLAFSANGPLFHTKP